MLANKTLGFIGTGTMNKAIVEGLCQVAAPSTRFVVSLRNKEKSAALAKAFPAQVTVEANNQAIVDQADWIFIGVLPTAAGAICGELTFRPGQMIVSVVASVDKAMVIGMCKGCDPANVVLAVPLPPVAHLQGVSLVSPADERVLALFDLLGVAVGCASPKDMLCMQVITCVMGHVYQTHLAMQEWMEAQGVQAESAGKYIGAQVRIDCFFLGRALTGRAISAAVDTVRARHLAAPDPLHHARHQGCVGRDFHRAREGADARRNERTGDRRGAVQLKVMREAGWGGYRARCCRAGGCARDIWRARGCESREVWVGWVILRGASACLVIDFETDGDAQSGSIACACG